VRVETSIPNQLERERIAAGYASIDELAAQADLDPVLYGHIEAGRMLPLADEFGRLLAALDDIPPSRLYPVGYLGIIGGLVRAVDRARYEGYSISKVFRDLADQCHLLLSRDEVRWFERPPGPDHRAEVFVNLSCGTQKMPHLLLDTVAVLERLGVSFLAAAGSAGCCGKPFRTIGRTATGEQISRNRIKRSLGWGARTHVNWCTACQVTSTVAAARRLHTEGEGHPVREVQVLGFLEEQVRKLGDGVPWKRRVPRRVLVEGHPDWSPFHRDAQEAAARLLELVPGVEVIDVYDGLSEESPCTGHAREAGWTPPAWYLRQDTAEGIQEHRKTLAEFVHTRGADTVSCQHHTCHGRWSRYASNRLAVIHPVSILADALDCAHPDRYQAAVRLGDVDEFLVQTRSVWQSWGISEDRARELAADISDPKFTDATTESACGHDGGSCQERLITIDVLRGVSGQGAVPDPST
jgi:hypothetical protein